MTAPAKANPHLAPDQAGARVNALVKGGAGLAPDDTGGRGMALVKAVASIARGKASPVAIAHSPANSGGAGGASLRAPRSPNVSANPAGAIPAEENPGGGARANARVAAASPVAAARFDDRFIETHHLIERYLERKLPPKGARDVENWCRAHPEYLHGLKLAERVQASLQLLEAAGQPVDLSEPKSPWWNTPYLLIVCVTLALASLVALWALSSRYDLLRSELDDARTRLQQGSLEQPATHDELKVSPDRAPGVGKARIAVDRSVPILVDLRIDMNYSKASQYRIIVDKRDQGRALMVNNLLKDSNGDLRLTFNTSGLAAGIYETRIDALPARGSATPVSEGWLILEVH